MIPYSTYTIQASRHYTTLGVDTSLLPRTIVILASAMLRSIIDTVMLMTGILADSTFNTNPTCCYIGILADSTFNTNPTCCYIPLLLSVQQLRFLHLLLPLHSSQSQLCHIYHNHQPNIDCKPRWPHMTHPKPNHSHTQSLLIYHLNSPQNIHLY